VAEHNLLRIQPQQILETTAAQTQGKETATEYNTVIPPAHALYTSPLLTTQLATHLPIGSTTDLPEPGPI
jgi:hypothetical protein